jgi:Ni/Fe-hydrogenase subunit HybB-like protein
LGLAIFSGLGMGLVFISLYGKQGEKFPSLVELLFDYLLFSVLFYMVLVFEEMLRNDSLNYILFGEHKYMFWVGQIGFLIFLPIALGWFGKQTRRVTFFGWAGLSALAGIFIIRMYALIPPKDVSELNGMEALYHGDRLVTSGYWPNLLETGVTLGLLALFFLVYLVMNKIMSKWLHMSH